MVANSLFGMVDDRDGGGVATLEFAQKGEQRCHIVADILVDAMQAHEGIEDEQPLLQPGDGLIETYAIDLEIEARLGAVITWTSRRVRLTPAAAQMPSRRRRTLSRASSAG